MLIYNPTPRQQEFHADPRPHRWYCAGYGSGKTTATVHEALALATVTHPGYVGIVAAPTYNLLFQSWYTEWQQWVPQELWRLKRDPLLGPHLVVRNETGTPSTILLRSTSNPWSSEGVNAAWLVFDEATREPVKDAVDVLLSRLRRGYPGRQRAAIFSGPPMTRRHWSAREFGTQPDPRANRAGTMLHWGSTTHAVVRARTRDNPHLPPDYEANLRSRPGASKAWCDQWLDALFGAMEGQVYGAFNRDIHVVPAARLADRRWRRVIAGTDWGWTHPGVMLPVAQDGAGNLFILSEEVHRERVVADVKGGWIPIARELHRRHRLEAFACDPSMPGNISVLHTGVKGPRCYGADNDLVEGLRRVTAALERAVERGGDIDASGPPALYISDACAHTIEEFESYSRRKAKDGSILEEPQEINDDAMDALRYAVMALTRAGDR